MKCKKLTMLFFSCVLLQNNYNKIIPAQLVPIDEVYAMPASDEFIAEVQNIADEVGCTATVEIAFSKQPLMNANSLTKFIFRGVNGINKNHMLYINQEWWKTLSVNEKKVLLGLYLCQIVQELIWLLKTPFNKAPELRYYHFIILLSAVITNYYIPFELLKDYIEYNFKNIALSVTASVLLWQPLITNILNKYIQYSNKKQIIKNLHSIIKLLNVSKDEVVQTLTVMHNAINEAYNNGCNDLKFHINFYNELIKEL